MFLNRIYAALLICCAFNINAQSVTDASQEPLVNTDNLQKIVNEAKASSTEMPSEVSSADPPDALTEGQAGGTEKSYIIEDQTKPKLQTEAAFQIQEESFSHQDHIQFKFDSTPYAKKLGFGLGKTEDGRLMISPYTNYPDFIESFEVSVFGQDKRKYVNTFKVNEILYLNQQQVKFLDDQFVVQLKAIGKNGRIDMTRPVSMSKESLSVATYHAGYGLNYLNKSNIMIRGGTVTVYGQKAKANTYATVQSVRAPVDNEGKYVVELLVPHGKSRIVTDVTTDKGEDIRMSQSFWVKDNDVFFFAFADVTYGQNSFNGPLSVEEASPDEFEREYVRGQLAFYLRGKVKGKYLITAMANTQEGRIQDIFRNLDSKDTKQLLRRLDADAYYPVYGDDSITEETAPTQGRFFIKIQQDKSYIMWGNYETRIGEGDFAQINQSLYGAKAKFESNGMTKFEQAKTDITLFAADPGTLSTRDEFRGTGGSIYFLTYQDITVGSDKLRIEVRDRHSGMILSVRNLLYGTDYDIDYLQGRIILNEALSSTMGDNDVVDSGVSAVGNPVFLVADYETTPVNVSLSKNYIIGGSAQQWLGDHFKVGAVGKVQEINGGADNALYGGNATVQISKDSYIKGSYTRSEGTSTLTQRAFDGGYTASQIPQITAGAPAGAIETEANFALSDLSKNMKGFVRGYYRRRDAGFSGLGFSTLNATDRYGASFVLGDANSGFSLKGEMDIANTGTNENQRYLGQVNVNGDRVFAAFGFGYESFNRINNSSDIGGRLGFHLGNKQKHQIYVLAQKSLSANGSFVDRGRYGLGANIQVHDKVTVGGEVSIDESSQIIANARMSYQYTPTTQFYLNYDISENRNNTGVGYEGAISGFGGVGQYSATGSKTGALSLGAKTRLNSSVSLYGEEILYHGQGNDGFTRSYGVDLTPWNNVTIGMNFENGTVSNLKRTAYGFNVGYGQEQKHISFAGEYRNDRNQSSNTDRKTYVGKINARYRISEQTTLLSRTNVSISENNQANINDGEFIETTFGLAYRPIFSDKLNFLFKYQYYYDVPTFNQVNLGGVTLIKERVHKLSADFNYDIIKQLTLGGKYGFKIGEQAFGANSPWFESKAQLMIARLDLHIIKDWDATVEGRLFNDMVSNDWFRGLLVGGYKHIGEYMRLGGGYSWSVIDFDLFNPNVNNRGFFINLQSKF